MKYGTIIRPATADDAKAKFASLKEFGFESCQLIFNQPEFKLEDAAVIRGAAEAEGIEISAQFVGYRDNYCVWDNKYDYVNSGINSPIFGASRADYVISAIPFVRELGVTDLILHAGHVPNDPFCDSYARILGAAYLIASRLKAQGMNLLFETGPESPISLLRLIRDIGTGNCYINLDTGNLIMYGFGNPVDAITTFGAYIRNTHFKDGLPPTDPDHIGREVAIGQGNVDFAKVVALLKQIGYDRFITIEREISGEQQRIDIIKSVEYIKRLWNE